MAEFCVLFDLLRELVRLFLCFIQISVQLRDLLALRLGENLGAAVYCPSPCWPGSGFSVFLSLCLFLSGSYVGFGDDAFHPLACPRAVLRARTPGVLPEFDASRWASGFRRVLSMSAS